MNLSAESHNNTLLRSTARLIPIDQPPTALLGDPPAATRTNYYRNSDRHLCQRDTSFNYRSDRALSPQNTHFLVHSHPSTIAAIPDTNRLLISAAGSVVGGCILLHELTLRTHAPAATTQSPPHPDFTSLMSIRGIAQEYLDEWASTAGKASIQTVCHGSVSRVLDLQNTADTPVGHSTHYQSTAASSSPNFVDCSSGRKNRLT